jgi:hypothetical protein
MAMQCGFSSVLRQRWQAHHVIDAAHNGRWAVGFL